MFKHLLFAFLLITGITAQAQNVGINTTGAAAKASAMLDIDATSKGVLIPRVALTALNVASPVTSPDNSLLVYNTATAGTIPNNVTPGFYYWSTTGSTWIRIADAFTGDLSKDIWSDNDTIVETATLAKTGGARHDSTKVVITDAGRLGVGTTTPQATFHTISSSPVIFDRYGNGDIVMIRKARTGSTYNNYLGINSYGIGLGQFVLTGHDGTNWDNTGGVCIQAFATQGWNTTQKGTALKFVTTANGVSARGGTASGTFILNNIGQGSIADSVVSGGPQEPTLNRPDAAGYVNARFNIMVYKSTNLTEKALYIKSVNSEALYIDAPLSAMSATTPKYLIWDNTTGKVGYGTGTPSDIRLKENITNTKYGLANLMKISVKDYEYKNKKGQTVTGFMAQDLYKIYPDAVYVGNDEKDASGKLLNPWTVDYGRVTPLIVKSVQEQQEEIDTLKQQVNQLQKQVEILMNEIQKTKK